MITGIKYYLDNLAIDINQVEIAFNFSSGFENLVYPESWATNAATGILNNTNSFFNFNGTGFFDGNTLLELNKSIKLDSNSTILFSFERLRLGDEVLLSSITGNNFNTYSGFCLGVNNANKIYFKYWNPVEGVFTFTHPNILANKNIIVFHKTDSLISIGNFNNNTFEFEKSEFIIKNNAFRENDHLFLGGNPVNVEWAGLDVVNFSGYIDNFYLFKNFPDFYENEIVKGLYSYFSPIAPITITECFSTGFLSGSGFSFSGVTGYAIEEFFITGTGTTGFQKILTGENYTGITGYENISLGFFVDNCGITKEIFNRVALSGLIINEFFIEVPVTGLIIEKSFEQIELSGLITGIENVFVTGLQCFEIESGGGVGLFIKTGFLSSLSFSEISMLSEIKTGEILELFTEDYRNESLKYNKDLIYNNINNNFYQFEEIPSDILLFINGQKIVTSGYEIINEGYQNFIVPNLDYIITGFNIEIKNFNENDFVFYDKISGSSWVIINTGAIFNLPASLNFVPYWVFKNGQKLIENTDYVINNDSIVLIDDNPFSEKIISIKQVSPNFRYIKSGLGSINIEKEFNHSCSQLYRNGVKQKINNNYIENSDFDLISGTFIESSNNFIIYNNTDDFFV